MSLYTRQTRNAIILLRWLEPTRVSLACWRKIRESRPASQQKIAFIRLNSAHLIDVFNTRLGLFDGTETQPIVKSP
jgi:hypothetical protein